MNNVKALIVDDEEPGRSNLSNLINTYCPGIEIVGQASSANEARAFLQHEIPDLIYLDIEMPNESGIDLMESLSGQAFHVIFVTAHEQYALRAIKLAAMDYLLKPISIRELQMANQKVLEKLNRVKKEELSVQMNNSRLSVPCMGGFEIIEKSSILYLQGENNYTSIITANKKFLIARTLKEFEVSLDDERFVRVHKTHIVNLQFVRQVNHQDGGLIIMEDGSRISISRRRYNEFISQLTRFAPMLRPSGN